MFTETGSSGDVGIQQTLTILKQYIPQLPNKVLIFEVM